MAKNYMSFKREDQTMTFAEALDEMVDGKKVRRLDWIEGGYLSIENDVLYLYKPNDPEIHYPILRTPDIIAEDWVVINQQ